MKPQQSSQGMPRLYRVTVTPGVFLLTISFPVVLVLRPHDLFSLHNILPQYARYLFGFEHLLLNLAAEWGERATLIELGARFDTGSGQ